MTVNITTIIADVVGFLIAFISCGRLLQKTTASHRAAEWPEAEKSDPLSQQQRHWNIVHIRDHIGVLVPQILGLNSLLGAILAVLLFRRQSVISSPAP